MNDYIIYELEKIEKQTGISLSHVKLAIKNQQEIVDELSLELSGYREAILNDKKMLGLKEKLQKKEEIINKLSLENKKIREIIKENTILVKDDTGDYQELNINPLELYDYKQRIKKTIQHIEENTINNTFYEEYIGEVKDLLKILKGDEK